jgi:hypothetical protein
MAKYRETQVTVVEWSGLGKARFIFSPDAPTRVVFVEDRIREASGARSITDGREIVKSLEEPTEKFILVNPDDNQPTGGDMSLRQLERAVYSLFYAEATRLDAAS